MLKPGTAVFTEVLSDVPIAKPLRLRVPTQSERIMAYVRLEQMRAQESREVETFEEADDFDLDDGEEWFSPYEEIFEADPVSASALPDPVLPGKQEPAGGDDVSRETQ